MLTETKQKPSRTTTMASLYEQVEAEPLHPPSRVTSAVGSLPPNGSSEEEVQSRPQEKVMTFNQFRLQYLVVFGAIMLADGLQGEDYSNGEGAT
jgi:hypothetical protein